MVIQNSATWVMTVALLILLVICATLAGLRLARTGIHMARRSYLEAEEFGHPIPRWQVVLVLSGGVVVAGLTVWGVFALGFRLLESWGWRWSTVRSG